MTTAIGYCRVSTDKQGETGYGLAAQKAAIHSECERKGWDFETMYADIGSGKTTKGRGDLAMALQVMADGEADVLVVAKLDRISRSTLDFATLMQRAAKEGWSISALDIGIDTTTMNGELIATIMMALAQWERRVIGQRTKDALASAKANGVVLGRPVTVTGEPAEMIRMQRLHGRSYHAIAKQLNESGVPTGQGGRKWYPSTVRDVYQRISA